MSKKKIKTICNPITSEKPQLTFWCMPPPPFMPIQQMYMVLPLQVGI